MAAAAGKRSVKTIYSFMIHQKFFKDMLRQKSCFSASAYTTKAKTKPKSSKSVKGSLLDSVLSACDSVQDVLDREDRIRELEEEIKMRQLTVQKLDKPLHPAKPPQFSSVPGPAAYQESSPIMFVNDPTQVQNQGGKSNIFQVLHP